MNVADVLTRRAERTPHAPAVIEGDCVWSYAELDLAVWRAAAAFRRRGLAPGDVVGVTLPSNALHLVAGYALARMGAVQISLPLRESDATRAALARRFRAVSVIGPNDVDSAWLEAHGPAPDPAVRSSGEDAGWKIVTTSGTTGTPKAVLQTHAMHVVWRELNQAVVPVQPDERYLAVVPLDFFAGFRLCTDVHWAGAAAIVGETPPAVEELLETIDRQGVSYLYLTRAHLQQMLPALFADRQRLPALRRLRVGSMVVTEALRREILRRLTAHLVVAYGTNDVGSPFTVAQGETLARFPESVGFAVPGVELQVADEAGRALPPGETGMVRVRAPAMPSAYLGNPEASSKAFRGGWYYPGDLGMLSPEDALYFKGRADDLMNYDGIKIYPSEVEAVLLEHPAIAEAAAFPVRSAVHQDLPCAAVVLRQALSAEALQRYCVARLGVRAPVRVYVLKELPRNPAGKVLRRELAERARAKP
ncbi:MAG TPA: class I adenylate-forming enzyme family protein [Burkholderiales bacterium]|nr:class I adenylate-forming enzyme family protein [Burkholderiales bacterium]